MQRDLVVDLAVVHDVALVGGKAHALSRMVDNGFTVPGGFVITAHAFQSMNPTLEQRIFEYFEVLQADFVAVRSSALNEDGQNAAWAGQLDTFLNTRRESLMANIQRCWDSARSNRALAYAQQKSLEAGKVAVVVQKMIQSDISGVAFSVHPILQDPSVMVIEAGFGLGEAIVSGQITPDTYIVHKVDGIKERFVAKQLKKLVKHASGENRWQELAAEGQEPKLTDAQIQKISRLVQKLEAYFGHPVDVEWAIHNGTLYVLQSRPITNLK
jgi:pyruvate,water dikinase